MLTDVIIPRVQAILAGIAGVGANVYPYIRIAADDAAFNKLFFDAAAQRIHGYTITRESTDSQDRDIGARWDIHNIVVRGYMGAKDADETETLFQNEIESVRATFAGKRHLEDVNGTRFIFWCKPMVCRNFAYAMFSGVLCHYAELLLQIEDYPLAP